MRKITHPIFLTSVDCIGAIASVPSIGPGKTDHAVFLPAGEYSTARLSQFSWILGVFRGSVQPPTALAPLASLKLRPLEWAEHVASLSPMTLQTPSDSRIRSECTGIEPMVGPFQDDGTAPAARPVHFESAPPPAIDTTAQAPPMLVSEISTASTTTTAK